MTFRPQAWSVDKSGDISYKSGGGDRDTASAYYAAAGLMNPAQLAERLTNKEENKTMAKADLEEKHSPIGASGRYRWGVCPGSVKLSEGLPDEVSPYAERGTMGHEAAYRILEDPKNKDEILAKSDLTDAEKESVMIYVNHILSLKDDKSVQAYENQVALRHIHELLYGTADALTYNPDTQTLIVSDYKQGAGNYVDVERNSQLMYYAIGAVAEWTKKNYPVNKIVLEVIQPMYESASPIRQWEMDVIDLVEDENLLREQIDAVFSDNPKLVAGDHCGWCKAKKAGVCPELNKAALSEAQKAFTVAKDPVLNMTPVQLKESLDRTAVLDMWSKEIKSLAYKLLSAGGKIDGYKLVDKRGTRKLKDEDDFLKDLKKEVGKTAAQDAYEHKLKSIAQLEATFKKQKKLIAEYTVKESSGTKLAPEDDKRPETTNIQDAFKNVDINKLKGDIKHD